MKKFSFGVIWFGLLCSFWLPSVQGGGKSVISYLTCKAFHETRHKINVQFTHLTTKSLPTHRKYLWAKTKAMLTNVCRIFDHKFNLLCSHEVPFLWEKQLFKQKIPSEPEIYCLHPKRKKIESSDHALMHETRFLSASPKYH